MAMTFSSFHLKGGYERYVCRFQALLLRAEVGGQVEQFDVRQRPSDLGRSISVSVKLLSPAYAYNLRMLLTSSRGAILTQSSISR